MSKENLYEVNPIDKLKPIRQKYYYSCGPCCLTMTYSCYGFHLTEDEIIKEMVIDTDGMDFMHMLEYTYNTGFEIHYENRSNLYKLQYSLMKAKSPIIVGIRGAGDENHFCVVKNMDFNQITLADPNVGSFRKLQTNDFLRRWHIDNADRTFLLVTPNRFA